MKKLVALITLFVFLLVSNVNAQVSIEKLIVSTPSYSPKVNDFNPELGRYVYEVSWTGIPAAEITLDVDKFGMRYNIVSKVRTYSAIDLIYKLRYHGEGIISAVDYLPVKTFINLKENSKVKTSSIDFYQSGRVHAVFQRSERDPVEYDFDPNNNMLDPFSSAFIARSLEWEPGVTRHFDTFNGRSRYLISFTSKEKIQMEVNDEMRDVWVVSPKVKKISSRTDPGKLREAEIYVTADEKREILQIVSEVFIGSVKTKLVSFTPSVPSRTMAAMDPDFVEYDF